MTSGEQTMPLVLPDPINWRNYTSRTYQIGTATCFVGGVDMGKGCNHLGIDFAYWGIGGTPILAIAPGTVVESITNYGNYGYGNNVLLGHDTNSDGNYDYFSRYAHMKETPEVSVGQVVDAGTQLGVVGTTGSSTGDHLHFELYAAENGRTVEDYYATNPEDRIDMLARGEVWYE
jgi:murein DD-endopeptidase MepM/ murein hydrolase activator NlpD